MRGNHLADVIRAIRAKGADVLLSLDTCNSGRLQLARETSLSHWRWALDSQPTQQETSLYAGSFTGLYAAKDLTPELMLPPDGPNRKRFGVFSYALADALMTEGGKVTPRQLAERIVDAYRVLLKDNRIRPKPVFESTNPDRSLLATENTTIPSMRGSAARIELTQPAAMRGASRVASTDLLRVAGKVHAPSRTLAMVINNQSARLASDGSFALDLKLQEGRQRLFASAVLESGETIQESFEVIFQPGQQSTLKGKRYALLIANQNYADPKYETLQTPIADADAIARTLRDRFGFATEIDEGDGKKRSLILQNATNRQILSAINRLRLVLSEEDSLVIYYAGHGWQNKELDQAFWLPVDAEHSDISSWVSAQQVSDQIKLMRARHVLIVSDSCFSGAMFRGGEPERPAASPNDLAVIAQLENRRSRIVITSGSNEPVTDGGGGGHSIFARALIDALRGIADKPAASETIFSQSIKGRVLAGSRQSPQMKPLANLGHDGGDFVFWPTVSMGN